MRNDNTIAHDRKIYQIEESILGKKVMVEERIDGKMLIVYQGKSLRYRQITKRPETTKPPVIRKKRTPYAPPPDHPWKNFDINRFKRKLPQTAVA
ncbi:MAG TPA: hypothetical protein VN328_01900 [Thermodesulfovibrionales bacterium]|nr:hypothetical protein [Thermodesulfovibrionales bacterium]